jgi:putative ABC transport system permease protein
MSSDARIWKLISRKIAGEATNDELIELQNLLQENPGIQYFIETILTEKNNSQNDPQKAEHAFFKHMHRMKQKQEEAARLENARLLKRNQRTNAFTSFFNNSGVFINYLKIIWRNLFRYKGFSFINISGLAIGMASAILILLWVQNELSMDQFHEKKDRIYVMMNRAVFEGKIECWAGVPSPVAGVLKNEYPQVEEVVRINGVGPFVVNVAEKHLEGIGLMADPGFLKVFSFPLLEGNIQTSLSTPRSMVVTEKFAKKLFGNEDAMGKVVRIDSNANFIISGVLKNLPNNTIFDFEYLIPFSYKKEVGWDNQSWDYNGESVYVLLKPGVTEKAADDRFRYIIKSHLATAKNELFLHPITKWWLYSKFENGKIAGGEIENVRLFSIIAVFILLIACINYMNLTTAKSIRRAKEVGIRKVVGAAKYSIVLRFLGESVMISFIAGLLGLVIVQFGIEGFNWLTWKNLYVPYTDVRFWLAVIAFILVTGIIAGSYPAFYLSAYRPIAVLKGTFKTAYKLVTVRKVLVVMQFSFAIAFIICSIIIYRQISFGRERDPGYNRDHLVFVYVKGDVNKKYQLIKNELLSKGIATAVTRSNSPITFTWNGNDDYTWQGKNPTAKPFISEFYTDNDFVETMGLKLIAGRTINTIIYPTDTNAVLLNESAMKLMAFKNPVGQVIKNTKGSWRVVGVVKDFLAGSPFDNVRPAVLQGPKNWFGAITIRLSKNARLGQNMRKVEEIFKKYNPEYPFSCGYVDQADADKIENVRRTGIQAELFGGLSILISCLGLFALAAYTAESRIKEIGVRKVLGASVTTIATLLSKDFLKLVFISFVIASPVAWWLMHAWLQNYEYRVNISWWIFALTGIICLLIALITVSYQAIKAALANPVISLRSE